MSNPVDSLHTVEEIAPHTWRIDEAGMANCYLLEGSDAALLIDTACGAGDLRACAERLTNKPILTAVTHRHPDHVGGAWRFGDYYACADDCRPVYSFLCQPFVCRALVRRAGRPESACARPKRVGVRPIRDGHVFMLGGRSVLVRAIPGHTRGSVVFIDSLEKLIFTGDDINPNLWMHLPGCTSLETWCAGADRLLSLMDEGYTAWNGHGDGRQGREQAHETKRLVLELLEKRKRGELRSRRGSYPSEDAEIVVRYRFR
jgi:hydroxyacylglutathione hydrolase